MVCIAPVGAAIKSELMLGNGAVLVPDAQLLQILTRHVPQVVVFLIDGILAVGRNVGPAGVSGVEVIYLILGTLNELARLNVVLKVEGLVLLLALILLNFCAVIALVLNIKEIPAAFALIFKEAFNFKAATGGAAGYGIMLAMHRSSNSRGRL